MFSVGRTRPFATATISLVAAVTIVAALLVTNGPVRSQPAGRVHRVALQGQRTALEKASAAKTPTIARPSTPPPPPPTTTTTTAPASAPTTTAPASAPAPAPAPVATVAAAPAPNAPAVVPPVGEGTAWGCGAALTYLQTYAAKGFAVECPGYAEGREAMTCVNQAGACPGTSVIAIADPCPQAYMNEASNSYVITGVADTPIDPFGPCP